MISTLLHLLRLCPFLCGGHRQLALENLALRQQLAVYKMRDGKARACRMSLIAGLAGAHRSSQTTTSAEGNQTPVGRLWCAVARIATTSEPPS